MDHVMVGVPDGGEARLRGHKVYAVAEVGQLGYVLPARALQGRRELEGDVPGHAVPDVAHHYVGGEAPGVVSVDDDLRPVRVVARAAGLPALVEDPGRNDEG